MPFFCPEEVPFCFLLVDVLFLKKMGKLPVRVILASILLVGGGIRAHDTTPWCVNGSDFIRYGKWKPNHDAKTNNWEMVSEAPCAMSSLHGASAIQPLRGKHLIFVGDSMLRQVYHTLVHGVLRQMPVVVDAGMVYTAKYCILFNLLKNCLFRCVLVKLLFNSPHSYLLSKLLKTYCCNCYLLNVSRIYM
jgi:hypothetical protein